MYDENGFWKGARDGIATQIQIHAATRLLVRPNCGVGDSFFRWTLFTGSCWSLVVLGGGE